MITNEVLVRAGIKRSTLFRYAEQGIVDGPLVTCGPGRRGRQGHWPDDAWVQIKRYWRACDALQALLLVPVRES